MSNIVVITNYVGLLKHMKKDTDLFLKDSASLRTMVRNYHRKALRLYIGEHVLLLDLASKPQPHLAQARVL